MTVVESRPLVAIACQGGGSHAAFGAGVLHRLLEDYGERYHLAGISGTSGGAVNAVLTWSALVQRGREKGPGEAQRRLRGMWEALEARTWPDTARNWWGQLLLSLPVTWEVSPEAWDLRAAEEMRGRLAQFADLENLSGWPSLLLPSSSHGLPPFHLLSLWVDWE